MDLFQLLRFATLLAVMGAASATVQSPPDFCRFNQNPCRNGGICRSVDAVFTCECPPNCRGSLCQDCSTPAPRIDGGACNPSPCQRDCVCRESCQHASGYYCRSASGYLGKNCTTPIPTLRCEPTRIVFSVAESFVKEYDMGMLNSYITIRPTLGQQTSCELSVAANGAYTIEIPLPFSNCGMEMTTSGEETVFKNQAWFNRRLANAMFDMPIPAAEFQCRYQRQYRLVTSLKPVVSAPVVISAQRDIVPTISLCKEPSCPGVCPENMVVNGEAIYTVGEMIHVTMTLDSGSQVTGIRTMFLSCDRSPSASQDLEIVRDGCGTTSGLPCKIHSSFSSDVVCVSFQTPRALPCEEFYIHAELQSCDIQNTIECSNSAGVRTCGISRRRRSAEPVVFVGPILLLNASAGLPTIRLSGMEEDEDYSLLLGKNSLSEAVFGGSIEQMAQPSESMIEPPPAENDRSILLISIFGTLLLLFCLVFAIRYFCTRQSK